MVEKNIRGFVLGDDKEIVVENTAKKEQQELQFERLGHRVTLISILIPILIAIIGYFIYADIQEKVTKVYDTGSTEVQSLSKDMDSKFSSLSVQLSELEARVNEKNKALENTVASLGKEIDSVASKLKGAESALAGLKKEVSGFSGKLSPIETNIKEMGDLIANSEGKLSAAVSQMTTEIGKNKGDLESLGAKIDTLASSKLDKKELSDAINTLNESLERSLANMTKKINTLEEKVHQTAISSRSSSASKNNSTPVKEGKGKQTEEIKMTRTNPAGPKANEEDFDMIEQTIEE